MIYLVVCVVVAGEAEVEGGVQEGGGGGRSRKGNRGLNGDGMRFDLA